MQLKTAVARDYLEVKNLIAGVSYQTAKSLLKPYIDEMCACNDEYFDANYKTFINITVINNNGLAELSKGIEIWCHDKYYGIATLDDISDLTEEV